MKNEKQEDQSRLDRKRSKREDLIDSDEYKNADPIQKEEFLLSLRLRNLLCLD